MNRYTSAVNLVATDPLAQILDGRLDPVDVALIRSLQLCQRLPRALDLLDLVEHLRMRLRVDQLADGGDALLQLADRGPQLADVLDVGPVFELTVLHLLLLALLAQLVLALLLDHVWG